MTIATTPSATPSSAGGQSTPVATFSRGATTAPVSIAMPNLFTPLKLGALTLPNRVVMAPMTRSRASRDAVVQPMTARYYGQRATAGLIITEATQVSAQATGYPFTPGLYTQDQVAAWKEVTDTVHFAGGRIFAQLWHVGRISHPAYQPGNERPVAPSAIAPKGQAMTYDGMQPFVTPRALELAEIPDIVENFADAAENALAAGFDGVEVHGANGYLIDQFLRSGSNHRHDVYGGAVENRVRLLLEVTDAVAEVVGAGRVGVRLSPINSFNDMHDIAPEALFVHAAGELGRRGLAYLHVVEGDFANPEATFDYSILRKAFGGTYVANGGYDLGRATATLAAGEADAISFGTAYISNPDLVHRLRSGADLAEGDRASFYGGDERGYVDYPNLDGDTEAA